jgi:hypothetical protein
MQEYKFEPDVEITAGVDTRDANLPPMVSLCFRTSRPEDSVCLRMDAMTAMRVVAHLVELKQAHNWPIPTLQPVRSPDPNGGNGSS